jgi:hypothetical protein
MLGMWMWSKEKWSSSQLAEMDKRILYSALAALFSSFWRSSLELFSLWCLHQQERHGPHRQVIGMLPAAAHTTIIVDICISVELDYGLMYSEILIVTQNSIVFL